MKTIYMLVVLLIYSITLPVQTKNNHMDSIVKKVNADRAFFTTLGNIYPADNTVIVKEETIEAVNCYWFTPATYNEDNIIIYLHGGMYGLGSIQSHQPMVSYISSTLSARVVFIEYGLAPENPFPHGLNDVVKVYREIIRKHPKAKISIIGDSAGGGLAVTVVHKLMEEKLKLPENVILISPWIYLQCNTPSYETRKELEPILKQERLLEYAGYYIADNGDKADPGQLKFSSFPPLFILVGSNEILFDDSRLFYEKIKPLQTKTKMKEYVNQAHVWPMTGDIHAGATKEALTDMKVFFTETMHG